MCQNYENWATVVSYCKNCQTLFLAHPVHCSLDLVIFNRRQINVLTNKPVLLTA